MYKKNKKGLFKLNNKGFAITSIIYSMLLLFIILMTFIILTLGRKKVLLDKSKNETIELLGKFSNSYEYSYTGDVQTFIAPVDGYYNIELWGAQGGSYGISIGGKGAYTQGQIFLNKGDALYIYVGGMNGYNGGGAPAAHYNAQSGGGATDIRLVNGLWSDFRSLKTRIMVAAGGGGSDSYNGGPNNGGFAGGIIGGEGNEIRSSNLNPYTVATGGTQISGGQSGIGAVDRTSADGGFGYGASSSNNHGGGGGSGYYGGGVGGFNASVVGSGAGGSSFISGYTGCDAIAENSTDGNIIHTGQSVHYSGKKFSNPTMIAGNVAMPTYDGNNVMVGNSGNGYAKITYVGSHEYTAVNLIENGSFENGLNRWSGPISSDRDANVEISTSQFYIGNSGYMLYHDDSDSNKDSYVYYKSTSGSINNFTLINHHIYYGQVKTLSPNSSSGLTLHSPDWRSSDGVLVTSVVPSSNNWTNLSIYTNIQSTSDKIGYYRVENKHLGTDAKSYFDGVILIDLTETFGAGNEPTKEWCDENISYFDGTAIIYK